MQQSLNTTQQILSNARQPLHNVQQPPNTNKQNSANKRLYYRAIRNPPIILNTETTKSPFINESTVENVTLDTIPNEMAEKLNFHRNLLLNSKPLCGKIPICCKHMNVGEYMNFLGSNITTI